jgi:uncharacterized protein YdaU (DUF1376 family)
MASPYSSKPNTKLLAEWFWTDRWMGSSAFLLPMEARGIYREMLTQAWRRGGRLPNNYEAIQRAIGATKAEWRRCWPLVERFWTVDGADLVNETQLEIYAKAEGMNRRASEHGLTAAQARHKQMLEQCPSSARAPAQAVPEQCPSSARAVPEHKPPISDLQSPEIFPTEQERSLSANEYARAEESGNLMADKILTKRAGKFLENYGNLYKKYRHGAPYLGKMHHDFQEALQLVHLYDDERLRKLVIVFLNADDEFCSNGTRTIAKFRSRASWCDECLRERGL